MLEGLQLRRVIIHRLQKWGRTQPPIQVVKRHSPQKPHRIGVAVAPHLHYNLARFIQDRK
jgi:hypothetical protein